MMQCVACRSERVAAASTIRHLIHPHEWRWTLHSWGVVVGLAAGVFLALMTLSAAMLAATAMAWPHPVTFPGIIKWLALGSGAVLGVLWGPSGLHALGAMPREWECLDCAYRWVTPRCD